MPEVQLTLNFEKSEKSSCRKRPHGSSPIIEYDEAPCPRTDLKGPCHIFRGARNGPRNINTYGRVWIKQKQRPEVVHKYLWEQTHGPVPFGMLLDHQCHVRACCNIDHLRVVTPKVNSTENIVGASWQIQAAKTHCIHGHEFTPENTFKDKKGYRHCRTCERAQHRCRDAKKKALASIGGERG